MLDASEYMASEGLEVGVLFSAIPARFYRAVGWEDVAMPGFELLLPVGSGTHWVDSAPPDSTQAAAAEEGGFSVGDWTVLPFDEGRDLEEVMALHDRANARRSASLH
eukprot:COSAG04_NODE_6388_length_1340_cov_1.183723_2_plen_106_part_01